MSGITYEAAIDEIFGQFRLAWIAGAAAICGSVPVVFWPGIEPADPPANAIWARVSQQTLEDSQSAFGAVFEGNKRRYNSAGLVFVQLFLPKVAQNVDIGRRLAKLARDSFRAQNPHVTFTNSRIQELQSESGYIRFNTVTEYEFDEFV